MFSLKKGKVKKEERVGRETDKKQGKRRRKNGKKKDRDAKEFMNRGLVWGGGGASRR